MKRQIQKLARAFGYDVRRKTPTLNDFLTSRNINVVLDVGANAGQFGKDLREHGYGGKIISFEPVSSAFAELRKHTGGDWEARNIALGSVSGQANINVSKYSAMSSFLETTDAASPSIYGAEVVGIETVGVTRLDDIFHEFKANRVFLKIDTQGFEQAVLDGAKQSLPSIAGVQLELPLTRLYANTWTFQTAIEYMARAGFTPSQFQPVNHDPKDPPSLLEVDCIFRRATAED